MSRQRVLVFRPSGSLSSYLTAAKRPLSRLIVTDICSLKLY